MVTVPIPMKVREVADGPVIADGQVTRLVRFEDGSGQVQVWKAGRWQEGGDVASLTEAPWATLAQLRRQKIPLELAADHPDAGKGAK